jgi:hypothetical protein
VGDMKNAYRMKLRNKREDNIKTDLKDVGCKDVDWIHLAEDRDKWCALVKTVMNLRVP